MPSRRLPAVAVTLLAHVVKAYDVRGTVPDQLDTRVTRALGAAFADVVVIPEGAGACVVGHDMRDTSPELSSAFADASAQPRVDVTIGLASTDGLYHASGALDPVLRDVHRLLAAYNDKLCRAGARPVGQDSGLSTSACSPSASRR